MHAVAALNKHKWKKCEEIKAGIRVAVGDCSVTERRRWYP